MIVLMKPPACMNLAPSLVWRLDKYVYGEDEAPFIWYISFRKDNVSRGGHPLIYCGTLD